MFLSITFLSYNDNELLLHTMKEFFNNTKFNDIEFDVHILIQNCSRAYIMSIEALCKSYPYKIILHTEDANLGVSKANNFLFNVTRNSKYVLHIEDDWILYQTNPHWLHTCIQRIENNDSLSTIALRRYGTDDEKHSYGWSRNIPYMCHKYKDNFNYKDKLGDTEKEMVFDGENFISGDFTPIKHFLFTFNPAIRRNIDYIKCGVYPLPEFEDKDDDIEYQENKKIHNADKWGWCEAITMEKTRDLNTEMFNTGIFVHFDDWKDVLKTEGIGPYRNDFNQTININCHFPILAIHCDDVVKNTVKFRHEFLRFIHFTWYKNTEEDANSRLKEIERILIDYKPRAIITVGNLLNVSGYLSRYIDFEYRKRWIHISSENEVNIDNVEICAINAFEHPLNSVNPVISVITPAYESKHRIMRPYHSLLAQTYKDWEWIIVDDSKSEDTWKRLTELANSDHRIKIYRRQKNDGSIGSNKRFCSMVANGDLIFELDHDDDILTHCFDRLINAYRKYPDAGFFYSDCVECFEDTNATFMYGPYFGLGFGSYYRQWWNNDWHYVYKTHRNNPRVIRHIVGVPNHFRCWTKRAYNQLNGHNPDLQVADDYELIVRTFLQYQWVHIPELLYIQYRNNGGDNFTMHRNKLIQYLVDKVRWRLEDKIHARFEELGVVDDVYKAPQQQLNSQLDYEIAKFQYPIIENVYRHDDQDTNNPLISVVVPTYNRPEHLKRALDSIFAQTYQKFEILLVGDKCPVLENFIKVYDKAKDTRLKWFNLSGNGGPGGHLPRNYALKMMCSTKWVAYLDDDNTWLPNHLEVVVKTIRENEDIDYVVNSMVIDGKELIFDVLRKGRIDTSAVVHKFDLCVVNGLWKSRVEGTYAHDFEFFNRILKDANGIWTKIPTLIYNTEFNCQSYNELIQM